MLCFLLGSCIEHHDDFMTLGMHYMSLVFTLLSWCGIFGLKILWKAFQERSGQPLLAFLTDEYFFFILSLILATLANFSLAPHFEAFDIYLFILLC